MTAEQFENDVAEAIDKALASLTKDDVIASLEHMISQIRRGIFDSSIPAA
jgi:hypothetical protein